MCLNEHDFEKFRCFPIKIFGKKNRFLALRKFQGIFRAKNRNPGLTETSLEIKPGIISNCFKHAGFVIESQISINQFYHMLVLELESYPEDEIDELARLWSELEIHVEVEQGVGLSRCG
jgi:hypothetical protein